jgi:hypothetical protein
MLLYFIFLFGHEEVTPTKVTLLFMPLFIELTLNGVMGTMVMIAMKMLFTTIIAEGEMMAVMWIEPLLTQLILVGMQPPKELPEAREYETRLTRLGRQRRWSYLWTRIETMLAPPSVVTRLGNRGMSKNEVRTTTRSSGGERKKGTCYNKRVAKSMNLLLVTCMLAASLQGTTAFDSDSKQIAIDNCSSRQMPHDIQKRLSSGKATKMQRPGGRSGRDDKVQGKRDSIMDGPGRSRTIKGGTMT